SGYTLTHLSHYMQLRSVPPQSVLSPLSLLRWAALPRGELLQKDGAEVNSCAAKARDVERFHTLTVRVKLQWD
ncbi:hypothetical protein WMY93_033802, partial [Mugilogobius chulae]